MFGGGLDAIARVATEAQNTPCIISRVIVITRGFSGVKMQQWRWAYEWWYVAVEKSRLKGNQGKTHPRGEEFSRLCQLTNQRPRFHNRPLP